MIGRLRSEVEHVGRRARNGVHYATGTAAPPVAVTPKDVVWRRGKVELWRYRSDERVHPTPVLLVHSLVTRSYVFDLTPGNSFVEALLRRGFDVYLVNWGEPDELESHYDLSTYCDVLLPQLVRCAQATSGSEAVVPLGYCLGGLLTLLYAAGHPNDPLAAVGVMATPTNFLEMGAVGGLLGNDHVDARSLLDPTGNVPPYVVRRGFNLLQPGGEIRGWVDLWQHLHEDQFVAAYRSMAGWATDHIPLAGGLVVELATLARERRLTTGRVAFGGREVRLQDITVPFASIVAARDHLVSRAAAGDLASLVGAEDAQEIVLNAGHVGLFVGRSAHKTSIPAISDWLEEQCTS